MALPTLYQLLWLALLAGTPALVADGAQCKAKVRLLEVRGQTCLQLPTVKHIHLHCSYLYVYVNLWDSHWYINPSRTIIV